MGAIASWTLGAISSRSSLQSAVVRIVSSLYTYDIQKMSLLNRDFGLSSRKYTAVHLLD